jgi:hypothetical protein
MPPEHPDYYFSVNFSRLGCDRVDARRMQVVVVVVEGQEEGEDIYSTCSGSE